MTISKKEGAVLAAVEMNAQRSIGEISALTKLHTHTVTYCLATLKSKNILGPLRASIDKYKLGIAHLHLLFSINGAKMNQQDAVIKWLCKSPHTGWLAEIGGQHQYALSLRTRHRHKEAFAVKELGSIFPNVIRSQSISIITAIHSFGRRFLGPTSIKRDSFKHEITEEEDLDLDSVDYKILFGLSTLNYSSERELAALLQIPQATLRRRITTLESLSIIDGYYHHIDTSLLGYQLFKLQIVSPSLGSELSERLIQFAKEEEHVVHLIETLGGWQAELQIEVRDATHASEIANDVRRSLAHTIEAVNIIPVLRVLHASPFAMRSK
jgi:DNA-binding Lrp family transcriptional regulator